MGKKNTYIGQIMNLGKRAKQINDGKQYFPLDVGVENLQYQTSYNIATT
jgi:hypothetical protein